MAKRRPQGDGMVRKRSDGRWEARIVIGHKNDGTPMHKSVFGKTQKETLDKLHRAIETYRDVDLCEDSRMTLGEWLDKWLDEYMIFTLRESTMQSYRMIVNHYIKPYLGGKPLTSLTTADIQKLYNKLKKEGRVREDPIKGKTLADSMVRGIHMMLHEALDAAVKERLIVRNPTNGTTVPKPNYPDKQVLDDGQLEKFLGMIEAYPDWRDFFYTECMTGLRRGKICGLKWSDIDFENRRLRVERSLSAVTNGKIQIGETKTGAGKRTIVLPPTLAALLAKRKENALNEWVFYNPCNPNLPMNPAAAYQKLHTILKNAELPRIRFHDLRHTFATMALENGRDIKTLSAMIGHVSAETTLNIYSHITDTMQQQAAARIDREIAGADTPIPEPTATDKASDSEATDQPTEPKFEPYKGKIRKPGTGCVTMINDHLYEGRFSPRVNGKRIAKNIYATTREECEEKLKVLIAEMKKEIAEIKANAKNEG